MDSAVWVLAFREDDEGFGSFASKRDDGALAGSMMMAYIVDRTPDAIASGFPPPLTACAEIMPCN